MFILVRADDAVYTEPDKRISSEAFTAIGWALTSLSFLFLVCRLITRGKVLHKLGWDDFLVTLAWTMLLVFMVTWHIKSPILYWEYDIVAGRKPVTADFLPAFATFMPFISAWILLFCFCLWCVKFSFLIFFRQLDTRLRAHRIWWWVVLVINVAGLIASVGDFDYKCAGTDIMFIETQCIKANHVEFENRGLYTNVVVDIVTDILILSIPVMIVWNVQISRKKKMILYSLFSATIVIIVAAIIRVVLVKPHPRDKAIMSIDWWLFWSLVEMSVAIMTACVASFRQFFMGQNNKRHSELVSEKHDTNTGRPLSHKHFRESFLGSRNGSSSRWYRGSSEHPSIKSKNHPGTTSVNQIHVLNTVALDNVKDSGDWKDPNSRFQWSITSNEV